MSDEQQMLHYLTTMCHTPGRGYALWIRPKRDQIAQRPVRIHPALLCSVGENGIQRD
jgi:hypothetical protein